MITVTQQQENLALHITILVSLLQKAYPHELTKRFVDAEDSPPSSCSVSLSRDCGTGGCVVSAITNYVSFLWRFMFGL